MKYAMLLMTVSACATASQRSADQAELRRQEAHAVSIRHPFEQVDGHVASDTIGGNYQLISASRDELCFRSLIPSENGNESLVSYSLVAIDSDGTVRATHHKSLLQLGLSQQTTLDAKNEGDDAASAVGRNQTGSATDSSVAPSIALGGHPPLQPVIPDANERQVDSVVGSPDYQRIRTFAAMNVCFAAQPTLTPESRFMVLQRGDVGLMNPHPLRAVWSLAPIAQVVPAIDVAPKQHANPFAPTP